MGRTLGTGLAVAGIAVMIFGISRQTGSEMQVISVAGGFIAATAGIIMVFTGGKERLEAGGRPTENDTPTRVRLVGVLVTLASLALPYIRVPLNPEAERTAYSLIGLIEAIQAGVEVEGGLTLLIFMAVVIAGAFASILHHVGGYVVLFGAAGYGYVVVELTGAEPLEVLLSEFQIGLYVALFGALVIVASSFLSYEAAEKDRSWYGSGR